MMLLLALLLQQAGGAERSQLSGLVLDAHGAAVPQASVSVVHLADGTRRATLSGNEGSYAIAGLRPGLYKLTLRKPGFQTQVRLNVLVQPGATTALDLHLEVGDVRDVVTVEDQASLVRAGEAVLDTLFGKRWLEELPLNGRSLTSLLDLAPGAVATPAASGEAGQFSAGGQRANANYFTVDGVSANSGVTGGGMPAQFGGAALPGMTAFGSMHNLASFEDVQDVRIQSSAFAPEHGRRPGAQVAVTTKAGSSTFHASSFYSWRGSGLSANDPFAAARGLGRLGWGLHHGGGSVSGPIVANRVFFFGSGEWIRLRQPYEYVTTAPSRTIRSTPLLRSFAVPNGRELGGGLAEHFARIALPARLDRGSLRIDYAPASRAAFFARFQEAPSKAESGYVQIDRPEFQSRTVTAGATLMVTPRWMLDMRGNRSPSSVRSTWRGNAIDGAIPSDPRQYLPAPYHSGPGIFSIAVGEAGRLIAGNNGGNRQGAWNWVAAAAYTEGAHEVRFGLDYLRLTPSRDAIAVSTAGIYSSLDDYLAGRAMAITRMQSSTTASRIETLSLFAQDTWRATPRLSIVFGTRWEITPPPASSGFVTSGNPSQAVSNTNTTPAAGITVDYSNPSQSLWVTRYTQFAPRMGAAYRLRKTTVARASVGLFFDTGFSLATDPVNGFPFNRWVFGLAGPSTIDALSPKDLRLPRTTHWNAAIEHGITAVDAITLSYAGARGRKLLRREGQAQIYSSYAGVVTATDKGYSDYHALQAQYRRRLSRGLQAMLGYTWSHSIDNGSMDSAVYLTGLDDRGSSSFDIRHNLTAAFHYEYRQWKLGGLARGRTGFPIDVQVSRNLLGLGFDNAARPDLVPDVPMWLPGRILNRDAFRAPAAGMYGNLGRNAVSGYGMWQADLSLERNLLNGERYTALLRLDAYNALNKINSGDPVRVLSSPLFGSSTSLLRMMLGGGTPHSGLAPAMHFGGPRTMQASLRFRF
ncbi:MAG: TonB-dependent receptor [Bryobacterales bacterium]|nr:TonB-dependent receptor [Bryobacterales bacterium]